ncbi:Heavy metal sensor histidine kinase, partial [Pseudomonas syringae pv. maculicola]
AAHAAAITPASLHKRLDSHDTPVELQQLSNAFNAMLDRIDDGYRRLMQFSADLAHEIRTPLNGILGFTHLLQKSELTPRQFDYLATIEKSADNLLSIIN